jgi:hypothetical protein
LSRKRSRDCPYTDDDPPLLVQDPNLRSQLTLELSHAENATPNRIEVGRQTPLVAQAPAIAGDQTEFIIRHARFFLMQNTPTQTLKQDKGSAPDKFFSPSQSTRSPQNLNGAG